MSDEDDIPSERRGPRDPIPFAPPPRRFRRDAQGRRRRPRVKKLRLLSILIGLALLAIVSTAFGMMMAVASDLPQIENRAEYSNSNRNSYLYDDHWRKIGIFAPPHHEVIDTYYRLGPMVDAIIAVEDKRFWTDPGVDFRGLARAFVADLTGKPTQGASTIAEQFVKQALSQEDNRTIFEKLREAALAFHLTHEWPRTQIVTEYLNSIYFGNGAYGAESAARVYFGDRLHYNPNPAAGSSGCGDPPLRSCAQALSPGQAALLAGMVANPSAFNPIAFPKAALARRDLVLQDMLAQGSISREQYDQAINPRLDPLPTKRDIEQPAEPPAAPYFTSWLRPQIIAAVGRGVPPGVAEYRAYYGGLKIRTTIDLPMQQAAQEAITENLPTGPGEPAASLVAIDNKTGQVRAMVGGPLVDGQPDFQRYPFNLATEGERQPGSAFKPFTLAAAFTHGYTPDSVFDSKPLSLVVPNSSGKEIYHVKNFANEYVGPTTVAEATAQSDNSVFTQLGLSPGVGTRRVRHYAKAMGIRTPVSTNYAMIIGGLKVGVSALDMAHAYETMAEGGRRVFTPGLGAPREGPVGIAQIQCLQTSCGGKRELIAKPHYHQVIPSSVAQTIQTLLEGVVQHGTGTAAAIPGVMVAGKTGTTSNYGDAWFVGWTPQLTVAVWVGFPNRLVPMTHLFNGGPVEGGTYPAIIWQAFMTRALEIYASEGDNGTRRRRLDISGGSGGSGAGTGTAATGSTVTGTVTQTGTTGGTGTTGTGGGAAGGTGTTGGGGGAAGGTGTIGAGGTTGGGGATGTTGGGGAAGGGTGGGTGGGAGSGGTGTSGGAGLGGG